MKSIFSKLSVITTLFIPAIANAHPGHDSTAFTSGLTHPFTGLDHLIMLFAFGLLVGCLSTSQSRKLGLIALSLLTLLGGLVAGQWFGVMNGVEEAIVASLFVVSIAISLAFSQSQNVLKLAVASCVAMMFFHGYAHGVEASGNTSLFAAGMAVGAVILMFAGKKLGFVIASRWLSVGVAAASSLLLMTA
ncbi:HupE/UreJ family protein [Vibrio hepatarius]|uniref:HupE/UreJ family protein n=1 Tax=Vibrio hepatarius TaxID=171383 RepID=UPI00148E4730|nr:HupE/UreJ family protein [Vibrio hepatarius]NOI14920.1 urease accessory protein UreJ [Vibrio hepatarius]